MVALKRMASVFLVGCLLASLPACGVREAAVQQKAKNDLAEVLVNYHNYVSFTDGKPPVDEKEFSNWLQQHQQEAIPALQRVLGQGYKVYWGTRLTKLPAGSGNTVLIYPPDAAAKGGLVGMADGSVRKVTAQEFASLAKPPEVAK